MTDYWAARKHLRYYQSVLRLANEFVPNLPMGGSVLDVGSGGCEYLLQLERFPIKHALDIRPLPELPGVVSIVEDFMAFQVGAPYDLVLCLQVLEHLVAPQAFAQKLLQTGKTVIISVPYLWPSGTCKHHRHDPVSLERFESWVGTEWRHLEIIQDGQFKRTVGVFQSATP